MTPRDDREETFEVDGGSADHTSRGWDRRSSRRWYALLALPYLGLLIPPLYAFDEPRLFGMPFFYWYQFLWLFLGAGIVSFVHRMTR